MTRSRSLTWRDFANAGIHRLTRAGHRARLAAQTRLRLTTPYQPDPFSAIDTKDELRSTSERFDTVEQALPRGPLSTLDVGCNEGYFVLRLAQRGGLCLGIDQDRNAVMVAESRARLRGVPNALFANFALSEENVQGLPRFDVVVCLSVFHHWARHLGEHAASRLLAGLASKAQSCLVFETGQPDEGSDWATALDFMGPDPRAYVRKLLLGFDFAEVRELGRFPTTVSDQPRSLWVALRRP